MRAENPRFQNKPNHKDLVVRSIAVAGTILGSIAGISGSEGLSAQEDGRAENFSIDMDPFGTPANTETVLGSRENCIRLNTNSKLDADEDGVDEILFDVTAKNIPVSTKMIAFAFIINYPSPDLEIINSDINGLLSTADGYTGFNASQPLPDKDGSFSAAVVDVNAQGASGSGFLMRVNLASTPEARKGNFPITMTSSAHIDLNNEVWEPKTLEQGAIAINENCGESPPITTTPVPPDKISLYEKSSKLPSTGGKKNGTSKSGIIFTALGGSFILAGLTIINRSRKTT